MPTPDEEAADPAGADDAYEDAVRVVRARAANAPVVLAENRNYGFRRNLFGLRPWGCAAGAASIAIIASWVWVFHPSAEQGITLGLLGSTDAVLLALWFGVVREAWVREAAWIYAERLMDQIELLDAEGVLDRARPIATVPGRPSSPPTVAVLTALACEFAAVTAVLRQPRPGVAGPAGDPNLYLTGELPSRDPGAAHQVVTTVLPHDGNRSAAVVATDTLRSFPTIKCVIFCGIAGGVPDLQPGGNVSLGDVIVAVDGVVDYDHTHTVDGQTELRRQLQGLSADMLRAVQELRAAYQDPATQLKRELDRVTDARFARPDGPAPARLDDSPKVHFGAIGSADRLLRDAALRDELARKYGIKGVEMEASGLAVGANLRGVPWFIVRGIADYCDNLKDDVWHHYASLSAAAFTALLLRHCRPFHL